MRLLVVVVLAVLGVQRASAADFRVVPFCHAQHNQFLADCSSFGPIKSLYVIGKIVKGDADRFREALAAGGPAIERVQLRSTGGDVDEALEMGRLLRKLFITVEAPEDTPRTNIRRRDRCSVEKNYFDQSVPCECTSACTLIAAGGLYRLGNEYYVHRIKYEAEYYSSLNPNGAREQYSAGMTQVKIYLDEMGTPPEFYQKMLSIPSSKVERLTKAEMDRFAEYDPSIAEWFASKCSGISEGDLHERCESQAQLEARYQGFAEVLSVRETTPDVCSTWPQYGFCE